MTFYSVKAKFIENMMDQFYQKPTDGTKPNKYQ